MINEEKQNSGSVLNIRHYIYNVIRKNGMTSVKVPSSYELSRMFGTTRRIAQRELERLTATGVLIGKPRIGTFTNPKPLNGPLFGIAYGSGDHFFWGNFELKAIAATYNELANRPCYVHNLRIAAKSADSCITELLSLDLDAVLWVGMTGWEEGHEEEFYRKVKQNGIPFATYAIPLQPGLSGVDFSYDTSIHELKQLLEAEKRSRITVLLTTPFVYRAFTNRIPDYFPTDHYQVETLLLKSENELPNLLEKKNLPDLLVVSSGLLPKSAEFLKRRKDGSSCLLLSLGPECSTDYPHYVCENPYMEAAKILGDILFTLQKAPETAIQKHVEKRLVPHNGINAVTNTVK